MSWRRTSLLVVLLSALVFSGAPAQNSNDGHFAVTDATTSIVDGVYRIYADFELVLSAEATDKLHGRLPLTIRMEAEFLNRLRIWFDPVEFSIVRSYQLSYLPVIGRYLVLVTENDETRSFRTLDAALEFIGTVDGLAIAVADDLDRDRRYEVRIRALLDKNELPGPLRLLALWRKDWSISTDWYTWRLDED